MRTTIRSYEGHEKTHKQHYLSSLTCLEKDNHVNINRPLHSLLLNSRLFLEMIISTASQEVTTYNRMLKYEHMDAKSFKLS